MLCLVCVTYNQPMLDVEKGILKDLHIATLAKLGSD